MNPKPKRPSATMTANAALQEMRNLAEMILQAVRPPAPKEPVDQCSPPHALVLNPNEGMWMHFAVGPIDGWFSFGDHGNPPFDMPVAVMMSHRDSGERSHVAVGVRTREIDPHVEKERWEIRSQFKPTDGSPALGMTHWRPLPMPPASIKPATPRP